MLHPACLHRAPRSFIARCYGVLEARSDAKDRWDTAKRHFQKSLKPGAAVAGIRRMLGTDTSTVTGAGTVTLTGAGTGTVANTGAGTGAGTLYLSLFLSFSFSATCQSRHQAPPIKRQHLVSPRHGRAGTWQVWRRCQLHEQELVACLIVLSGDPCLALAYATLVGSLGARLLDPDFRAPYVNLGVAYLRMKLFEEAIHISEACLDRHPSSPQCQHHGSEHLALPIVLGQNQWDPILGSVNLPPILELFFVGRRLWEAPRLYDLDFDPWPSLDC